MIHSFLLIGQSNMAGRGDLNEAPKDLCDKIQILRNGRWQSLFRPINPDRAFSGYCLAEAFAEDYSKNHPDVTVGLIPCADGGTSLNQWQEGGLLFDNAVYQAKLAARTSNIAGILWHQGEADCGESMYPLYENKMQKLIDAFNKALGLENVPFLLGALGDYLPECPFDPNLVNYKEINKALMNLSEKNKFVGYVKANNLSSKSDFLHFNTESLMEFGHRFYCEFEKLEDKAKVFEEKSLMDDAFRSEMEKL